jgi:hypothetical protein
MRRSIQLHCGSVKEQLSLLLCSTPLTGSEAAEKDTDKEEIKTVKQQEDTIFMVSKTPRGVSLHA